MEMFLFIYYSLEAANGGIESLSRELSARVRSHWKITNCVDVGMCGYMREGGGRCNEREREKTAVAAMQQCSSSSSTNNATLGAHL
jgi:hypothetical protein